MRCTLLLSLSAILSIFKKKTSDEAWLRSTTAIVVSLFAIQQAVLSSMFTSQPTKVGAVSEVFCRIIFRLNKRSCSTSLCKHSISICLNESIRIMW